MHWEYTYIRIYMFVLNQHLKLDNDKMKKNIQKSRHDLSVSVTERERDCGVQLVVGRSVFCNKIQCLIQRADFDDTAFNADEQNKTRVGNRCPVPTH